MKVFLAHKTIPIRIFVRPTRPTERFKESDLYIAWVEGEVAGCMAITESDALQKATANRPEKIFTLA